MDEAFPVRGHGGAIDGILTNMKPRKLHYVVYEQDGAFVAQCLDVDVASEGDTEAEAVSNLGEALELYFESDAPTTIAGRKEIRAGTMSSIARQAGLSLADFDA